MPLLESLLATSGFFATASQLTVPWTILLGVSMGIVPTWLFRNGTDLFATNASDPFTGHLPADNYTATDYRTAQPYGVFMFVLWLLELFTAPANVANATARAFVTFASYFAPLFCMAVGTIVLSLLWLAKDYGPVLRTVLTDPRSLGTRLFARYQICPNTALSTIFSLMTLAKYFAGVLLALVGWNVTSAAPPRDAVVCFTSTDPDEVAALKSDATELGLLTTVYVDTTPAGLSFDTWTGKVGTKADDTLALLNRDHSNMRVASGVPGPKTEWRNLPIKYEGGGKRSITFDGASLLLRQDELKDVSQRNMFGVHLRHRAGCISELFSLKRAVFAALSFDMPDVVKSAVKSKDEDFEWDKVDKSKQDGNGVTNLITVKTGGASVSDASPELRAEMDEMKRTLAAILSHVRQDPAAPRLHTHHRNDLTFGWKI